MDYWIFFRIFVILTPKTMVNMLDLEISELSKRLNFEIDSYKQSNKFLTLNIKAKKRDISEQKGRSPKQYLIEGVRKASFVNFTNAHTFRQGKKDDEYDYYLFVISVKKEFYNGQLDTSKLSGKFLSLIEENKITTIQEFVSLTLDMVYNMSKHSYSLPYKERRALRNIKKSYIKFLYKNKFVSSIKSQVSYCDDNLLEFTIADKVFHLRFDDVDFITSFSSEIEIKEEVYQKRIIDTSTISYEFEKWVDVFQNINNLVLFRNAEIPLIQPVNNY